MTCTCTIIDRLRVTDIRCPEHGAVVTEKEVETAVPTEPDSALIDLGAFRTTPLDEALLDLYASKGMRLPGGPSTRGWSKFSTFMTCPYKYKLKYLTEHDLSGSPSIALEVGALWHLLAANEYLERMHADGLKVEFEPMNPGLLVDGLLARNVSAQVVTEAQRLHTAYQNYYENDYLRPLAVEVIPESGFIASCRYDLIAKAEGSPTVPDGTWIVEHKTASRLDRGTQEGWKNDGQILIQMAVWKKARLDKKYGRLAGVIVNLVVKTKVPQFVRILLPVNKAQIRAHEKDLEVWSATRQMCEATGVWPRNRASCVGRYGLCEAFDHCAGGS